MYFLLIFLHLVRNKIADWKTLNTKAAKASNLFIFLLYVQNLLQ